MSTGRVPWQVKFAALCLIWGSSYLLMKVGVEAMSGVQVAALRVLSGGAVLLLIVALTRTKLPRGARTWAHLTITGFLLCTLPWTLFAVGEERVDSAIAGISNATTPIAAVVCSLLLLPGEPIGRLRLIGVGVGFLGVVLILQPWSLEHGPDPVGFALVLGASASYGVGWTWVRRFLRGADPGGIGMPAAQILVGMVQMPIVLILWWWLGSDLPTPWSLHSSDWVVPVLAVLALGVVGSALAQTFQYDVVRAAGPTVATSVTYPITVVSALLGVLVLDERLSPMIVLGGLVVLGAAVLIGRGTPAAPRRSREADLSQPPPEVSPR